MMEQTTCIAATHLLRNSSNTCWHIYNHTIHRYVFVFVLACLCMQLISACIDQPPYYTPTFCTHTTTQWQGVVQCTEEHLRHLHAAIKKHSRSTGPAAARMQPCTIGPVHLCIGQCIGTGGFARIYQVTHSCDDDEISCPATQSALKLQQPSCAWEFFILTLLQARCHPAAQCLFANAQQLFLFPNASGLLLTLGTHGTLQELVNVHLRAKMARWCSWVHCMVLLILRSFMFLFVTAR